MLAGSRWVGGWWVGGWLFLWLVCCSFLVVGGSGLDDKIAPDYLVPPLRTWKGGGWELVVACRGLVGGLESRLPRLQSENLEKTNAFSRF